MFELYIIVLWNTSCYACTVYENSLSDPWNTSMRRAFVVPNRLNYDVRVARLPATIDAARVDAIDVVERIVVTFVRRRFPLRS